MRTLYLDCGMGAAGDMLTAALLELLPRPEEFVKRLNGLGIPGVTYHREQAEKCGITGTHITVTVDGHTEGEHDHEHDHEHHHHHSGMEEISHLIGHLPVSEKVRADIRAVYDSIAQAESHVHGVPVTDIHFHEVGTMDAVAVFSSSEEELRISADRDQCQDLVRFFALRRIKPHTPPLVRAPVNSFEFQPCDRTPQVEYLLC